MSDGGTRENCWVAASECHIGESSCTNTHFQINLNNHSQLHSSWDFYKNQRRRQKELRAPNEETTSTIGTSSLGCQWLLLHRDFKSMMINKLVNIICCKCVEGVMICDASGKISMTKVWEEMCGAENCVNMNNWHIIDVGRYHPHPCILVTIFSYSWVPVHKCTRIELVVIREGKKGQDAHNVKTMLSGKWRAREPSW